MKPNVAPHLTLALILITLSSCSTAVENVGEETISSDVALETVAQAQTDLYTLDSGEKIPIDRSIMGDYFLPESFRDLVENSDTVVIGTPIESIEESESFIYRASDGALMDAYSVTEFETESVLKGNISRDSVIKIGQSVVLLNENELIGSSSQSIEESSSFLYGAIDNYSPIRKGSKYILFLSPGSTRSDVYFPTGIAAGRVNVDGTDELPVESQSLRKIRDYAVLLYQTASRSPLPNVLEGIVEQSDSDFVQVPINPDDIEPLPPELQNIPDVDVEVPEPIIEELPPAIDR